LNPRNRYRSTSSLISGGVFCSWLRPVADLEDNNNGGAQFDEDGEEWASDEENEGAAENGGSGGRGGGGKQQQADAKRGGGAAGVSTGATVKGKSGALLLGLYARPACGTWF
jgi:hypothetical protein